MSQYWDGEVDVVIIEFGATGARAVSGGIVYAGGGTVHQTEAG